MTGVESINEEAVAAVAHVIALGEAIRLDRVQAALREWYFKRARLALEEAAPLLRLSDVPGLERQLRDKIAGEDGQAVDIYEMRERGVRVLGDEQCCELGCDGGACESCPCCCAGWCVFGHSGEIPDRDLAAGSDYRIWLAEAVEHNPVAKALAERDRLVGVDFDDEVSS